MNKKEIRSFIRQKKKEMSPAEIERAGTLIADKIFVLPEYTSADIILTYMAVNQEVITSPIIRRAVNDGKTVGIPKTFGNRRMNFFAYDTENLTVGFGGIPEPASANNPVISEKVHVSDASQLSAGSEIFTGSQPFTGLQVSAVPGKNILIFIPGLAFGRDMNRIGYGGGYYDTFLEKYTDITKAALCYDFQLFKTLPCEEHDVKMDLIITEKEIVR